MHEYALCTRYIHSQHDACEITQRSINKEGREGGERGERHAGIGLERGETNRGWHTGRVYSRT